MSCLRFNQTIVKQCGGGTPGIKRLWVSNYEDVGTVTESAGLVTAISSATTYTGGTDFWYSVHLNRESSSFMDQVTLNTPSGNYFYKPTLTLKLGSLDVAIRTLFNQISQTELVFIVETVDGKQYLLGKAQGMTVETATMNSGTAAADTNKGFEGTFSGAEPEPYIEINTAQWNVENYTF